MTTPEGGGFNDYNKNGHHKATKQKKLTNQLFPNKEIYTFAKKT